MALFGGWRLTKAGILFVIGVVVLAGLVTGGIFLVKNRGETARREEAVKIAEQNLKDESQVAVETTPVAEVTEEAEETQVVATEAAQEAVVAAANPEALPETGPAELQAVGNILIVTLLALTTSFYVASRRTAKDL